MTNKFYQLLLTKIDEGIYFVDETRKITFWNKGAERITGFNSEEVVGSYCYDNILNHVDDKGNHLCLHGCPLEETIKDGQPRTLDIYLHHKKGHRVPINVRSVQIEQDGKVLGAVELFTDESQTHEIAHSLEELSTIVLHDQLTELPNRRYLDTFLDSRFNEYATLGIKFGMLFIDIDHFKKVNDTYGHKIGDDILKMVSKTMGSCLRSSDLLARNGGEEFVAVVPLNDISTLKMIAEKMRVLTESSSLRIDNVSIGVTVSIGATLVEPDDDTITLIERADKLMYQSKTTGRNRVTVG